MKRQAKRIVKDVGSAKRAEIARIAEVILREEKKELSARARKVFAAYDTVQTELSRAAELLKAERQKQGLSLTDLQERTGINRAALCRLETLVEVNPKVATLQRIAEGLGKRLVVGLEE